MKIIMLALVMALQAATPSVQTIAKEMMSSLDTPTQAVARTPDEWAALWKRHAPAMALPTVDLASRTVVAVFLGSRPSGGFAVEIVGAHTKGGVTTVEWREKRPGPDEMNAQIITSPAHIASIPKVAGDIRFEKLEK
jgi:hypothetical protein